MKYILLSITFLMLVFFISFKMFLTCYDELSERGIIKHERKSEQKREVEEN